VALRAWRVAKARHAAYDGTGARLVGGRWNDAGREVIYAADSFAGAILEIVVHALRPRTLPGPHHAVQIDVPDDVGVETLEPEALVGWESRGSPVARAFGNRWLSEGRSAVLVVPALTARPVARNVLINPAHGDASRIVVSSPFDVPWDERLF
jgi:RES domain-containing protein